MKAPRGYTVLELLVVVAVLMILAGMALPMAGLSEERRLDTVELQLQDAVDFAQKMAYKTGIPHGVKFSAGGDWFAVANNVGVAIEDPLTRGDYVVRLKAPNQPKDSHIEFAQFGVRPVAAFDEKGVLELPGELRVRCGSTERRLYLDTATTKLAEIPASP